MAHCLFAFVLLASIFRTVDAVPGSGDFSSFQCSNDDLLAVESVDYGHVKMLCAPQSLCNVDLVCQSRRRSSTCRGLYEYVYGVFKFGNGLLQMMCCDVRNAWKFGMSERCNEYTISTNPLGVGASPGFAPRQLTRHKRQNSRNTYFELYRPDECVSPEEIVKDIRKVPFGYVVTACYLHCSSRFTNGYVHIRPLAESGSMFPTDYGANDVVPTTSTSVPTIRGRQAPVAANNESTPALTPPIVRTSPTLPHVSPSTARPRVQPAPKPSCFSGDMTVRTETGPRTMDSVRNGDKVRVSWADYQPVESFLHREPSTEEEFLTIVLENNGTLSLTANHLLPVVPCSHGLVYVWELNDAVSDSRFAKRARVGDCLAEVTADGLIRAVKIRGVVTERKTGIYAPLTPLGTIVVNDIVVSCYASVENHRLQLAVHRTWMRFRSLLRTVSSFFHCSHFLQNIENGSSGKFFDSLVAIVHLSLEASLSMV